MDHYTISGVTRDKGSRSLPPSNPIVCLRRQPCAGMDIKHGPLERKNIHVRWRRFRLYELSQQLVQTHTPSTVHGRSGSLLARAGKGSHQVRNQEGPSTYPPFTPSTQRVLLGHGETKP